MSIDKKLKKLFYLQIWIALVGLTIESSGGNRNLVDWLFMTALVIFVLRLIMMIYEAKKLIFPSNRTYKPPVFKKVFFWLFESEKLPQCLINSIFFITGLYIFNTVLFMVLEVKRNSEYGMYIFLGYSIIELFLLLYVYYGIWTSVFLERFKIFNKHNLRYAIFITYNKTCKWPTSTVLGKCEILGSIKRRGKIYVTIKMLETGVVYEDILVISELHTDRKIYKLHEICDVKYIV